GATVVVDVSKGYPRSPQWVDFKYESTQTDANGRWSFLGVPAQPDSVELAAYHHLYLAEHSFYVLEEFKHLAALRDGTATVRLHGGTTVGARALAREGTPAAGAEIIYGEAARVSNNLPPIRADAQGRFVLGIKPGVVSKLIAKSAGSAPTLQAIRVG